MEPLAVRWPSQDDGAMPIVMFCSDRRVRDGSLSRIQHSLSVSPAEQLTIPLPCQ